MNLYYHTTRLIVAFVFAFSNMLVTATELVYVPKNPSFGGNPLNGTFLLNNAQLTNKFEEAAAPATSQLDQFNRNLQNVILSRLAGSISGGLFDMSGRLIPGTISTTDFTIVITQINVGPPAILGITTIDKISGASTSFQVTQ